jgi:hemolysin activation/secretion protein
VLTGELRYTVNFGALPGSLQLAAFIDTGEVKLNEEPFTAGANRRRLSGGGVGFIWGKAEDFTLRLSLAHRIGNERATAGTDSQSRAWLQAIKYF